MAELPLGHLDDAGKRLDAARDASDEERLRVLENLYASLEEEIDSDQASPTGR